MSESPVRPSQPTTVAEVLAQVQRPSRMVVTAGMPYANGPLHVGHLAGAHMPADIFARWCRMLIGAENVLFVCGTDDHGSTSEIAAAKAGKPVRNFIDEIHVTQQATLSRYGVSLNVYTGTSQPDCFPIHAKLSQEILSKLNANGLLSLRTTEQWYDPKVRRFLPDRYVRGTCPNPKCGHTEAYSDECDVCGHQYPSTELINPRSTLSDALPEMRPTTHWWLDMSKVSESLRVWLQAKEKSRIWRPAVLAAVKELVIPSLHFANVHEATYKEAKGTLPPHKSKYTVGKRILLQFNDKAALAQGIEALKGLGIESTVADEWAHRSITRDITWGIPVGSLEPALEGKTLYVWPDSLIAPIAFSQVALARAGRDPQLWKEFWCDPKARVTQFLGQDNVFFYVLMQGALWFGSQANPHEPPIKGELQLTDIVSNCHLMIDGEKMSKQRGNFFTGDQLIDEKGYDPDQIRYALSILTLAEKQANFDFAKLAERNAFLAGPMNSAFEKPISACLKKFDGVVPEGTLNAKVVAETLKIVQRYMKSMERADYSSLIYEIENYARSINSQFNQFKPHDDRHDLKERQDALYTCFYVLKNLMIMLYPFVPATMERLRISLALDASVWSVDQLGIPIPAGHKIAEMGKFFPDVPGTEPRSE